MSEKQHQDDHGIRFVSIDPTTQTAVVTTEIPKNMLIKPGFPCRVLRALNWLGYIDLREDQIRAYCRIRGRMAWLDMLILFSPFIVVILLVLNAVRLRIELL